MKDFKHLDRILRHDTQPLYLTRTQWETYNAQGRGCIRSENKHWLIINNTVRDVQLLAIPQTETSKSSVMQKILKKISFN